MMKKRMIIVSLILIFMLCLSTITYAASDAEIQSADALYELGLFKGTGTKADGTPEYSLDRVPTRAEAVTMLVRLLGKEEEALSGNWDIPFTDVDAWAVPYVGYAYANGLTNGTGATTFGSTASASETQYLTFILRAIGYDDSKGDFRWDEARTLTDKIGITTAGTTENFTRGTVASVSFDALKAPLKGSDETLAEKLIKENVFKEDAYSAVQGNQKTTPPVQTSIPIGVQEVNEGLLAMKPDAVDNDSHSGAQLYHLSWNNLDFFTELCSYIKSSAIAGWDVEEHSGTKQWNWVGARVEISYNGAATVYSIEKFGKGSDYQTLRYGKSDGSSDDSGNNNTESPNLSAIPIGIQDINDMLFSYNPDAVSEAGQQDGSQYHFCWKDRNMYQTLINYFDSVSSEFEYITDENTMTGTDVELNIVRVEISKGSNGIEKYSVELLSDDGSITGTDYYVSLATE